jgi:phosphate acyltransferase
MIHIAIDGMGGDNAPEITVKGAVQALAVHPEVSIILYGDEAKLKPYLTYSDRIKIVHTKDMVSMDEKEAINAMRHDKTSSLAMAMHAVQSGQAQAVVSAGPTGPMVAGAHVILKRIKGMKRTALMPILNTNGTYKLLLDVGANIETKPEHLVQYATAATIYATHVLGVKTPKVGLLNNGSEEGKGRELEQEAFQLLKATPDIAFVGNVEAKGFFESDVNIYITDGYTGNAVLKAIEGTLKTFSNGLKSEIKKSPLSMLGAVLMSKSLRGVKKYFQVATGAILLGVNGAVIKAHGSSTAEEFASAIDQAVDIAKGDVVARLRKALEDEVEAI